MTDAYDLDGILAEARGQTPETSPDLLARVLSDGLALQPRARQATARPARPGLWSTLAGAVGGVTGLAGLATATVAGLWLGFAQPAPIGAVTDGLWPDASLETVELIPGDVEFLTEG